MLEKMLDMIRGAIESLAQVNMSEEMEFVYPQTSPAAGAAAGSMILKRGPGTSEYIWFAPKAFVPERALAEITEDHELDTIGDLAAYLVGRDGDVAFVQARPDLEATVHALDPQHPERGLLTTRIARHPAWSRWTAGAGKGAFVDLDHRALADLVLDNREDLTQPALADHLAAFRAARSVEYDADLGRAGYEGVRVTWKGSSGKAGATSALDVPRGFSAQIPAYTGAWTAGQEPRHVASFRLRVLPGEDGDAAPRFRLLWVNHADFELEAAAALVARVREVMGSRPVYAGRAISKRIILPGKAGA